MRLFGLRQLKQYSLVQSRGILSVSPTPSPFLRTLTLFLVDLRDADSARESSLLSALSSGSSPGWSLCSQQNSGSSLACFSTPQDLADGIRILILGMSRYSLGLRLKEAFPGAVRVPEARLPVRGQVGIFSGCRMYGGLALA